MELRILHKMVLVVSYKSSKDEYIVEKHKEFARTDTIETWIAFIE
jgi:hypothetical protein